MKQFPSGAAFRSPTYPNLIAMYQNTAASYPQGSARRDYLDRSVAVMQDRYARVASPPRLHHAKAHMPATRGPWQPGGNRPESPPRRATGPEGAKQGRSAGNSLASSSSLPDLLAAASPPLSLTSPSPRPLTANMKPAVSPYAASHASHSAHALTATLQAPACYYFFCIYSLPPMQCACCRYAAAVLARPANLSRGGLYRDRMASGAASGERVTMAAGDEAPWGRTKASGNAMSPDLRMR